MRALLSRAPLNTDLGLLLLRLAVGFSMLVFHGWGKLTGGPEAWARVGGSMGNLGIGLWPEAWGLAAALAESLGSLLLILGLILLVLGFQFASLGLLGELMIHLRGDEERRRIARERPPRDV